MYAGFIGILSFLSGLLFFEYVSLRQQVNHIVQIKQEYQTYTNSFKKVLRDYQRLKEGYEDTASDDDDEKKKEQPFLILNREPHYLRSSALHYLRKHRMESSLAKFYEVDELTVIQAPQHSSRNRNYGRSSTSRKKNTSLINQQLAQQRSSLRGNIKKDISFIWPVDRSSFWISSFYGSRRKPDRSWGFHHGIDLAALKGTPVKAADSGIVVESGVNTGYGNTIVIMHNNKYKTRYAHLHKIHVRVGQPVKKGQLIGQVGDTGLVRKRGRYASHLHLEVYMYGKRVNPLYFFV